MTATERAQLWRNDPVEFITSQFGVDLDAWQIDALTALRDSPRICLKACTGPGKSALLAMVGWWRLACFAGIGEHPKGAALSITRDNLKDNLWSELAKWQSRSAFLKAAFTWTSEKIYANDHPETWFLSARSFSKDADAESIGRALSGLHSAYPFILLDETGDMPASVGRAAEQIFTGSPVSALIIQAGNPTSTAGLLYQCCNALRSQWHIITITADPDDPKRTPRVSAEHAQQQIDLYGRDNPWVMSTILGLFPSQGFNALLSVNDVEASIGRKPPIDSYSWAAKILGVDVARFGDDRTVIFPRQGSMAFKPLTMRHQRTTDIAARVAQSIEDWGGDGVFVDDTGHWGHGVIDNLITSRYRATGVQFHGAPLDPRYKNKRAEMWFSMAEWVKQGGCLPHVPELVGELTTPTYSFTNGKIILEDKDQVKARLGRSPDLADALALTFAFPVASQGVGSIHHKPSSHVVDYNPYEVRL